MGTCQRPPAYAPRGPQPETHQQPSPQWAQLDVPFPQLVCSHAYAISNLCVTKGCNSVALYCNEPHCKACSRLHQQCSSIRLEVLTNLLRKRAEGHRSLEMKMLEIEQKMLRSLQEKSHWVLDGFFFEGFDQKFLSLYEQVYLGTSKVELTGQEAQQFYWKLREANSRLQRVEEESLKRFQREIGRITASFLDLKRNTLEDFAAKLRIMEMDTRKEIEVTRENLANDFVFQSAVVPAQERKQVRFIHQVLDCPKQLNCLFRASEHSFQARKFHELCDGVSHTLTLLKTEFGKTLGGYTPLSWNSSKGFGRDEDLETFLLSVDLFQKMQLTPEKRGKAIQCSQEFGPVFGSGADLAISNDCNTNTESCMNFPHCFNYKSSYKYNQQTWTDLTGARQGKNFRILQYQVFQVIW